MAESAENVDDVFLDDSKDSSSNDSGCVARFSVPDSFDIAQDVQELAQSHEQDAKAEKHHKLGRLRRAVRVRLRQSHPYGIPEFKERKLRMAASVCNVEEVTRLLENGTNPNCTDEYKRSPLHLASCRGYTTVVTELLKFGANPNIVDLLGNTPLHLAVISASSNSFNTVVKILLEGGASVHALDRNGKNPFDLAESKLRLYRSRFTSPTPEIVRIVNDLLALIYLIAKYYIKEETHMQELTLLEKRLEGLSTKDEVTSEADLLLANIERLTISK